MFPARPGALDPLEAILDSPFEGVEFESRIPFLQGCEVRIPLGMVSLQIVIANRGFDSVLSLILQVADDQDHDQHGHTDGWIAHY